MSKLQIIGLCLLSPFLICVIIAFGVQIVEDIKKNDFEFVGCIITIMSIVGLWLLFFG